MKDFHCCATCKDFKQEKTVTGMRRYCSRLGYDTQPNYKFNCWTPSDRVKKVMKKHTY